MLISAGGENGCSGQRFWSGIMRMPLILMVGLALSALAGPTMAAALTAGNIVVATGFSDESTPKLAEFTPAGALVQSFSITTPNGTQNVISGIAVGPSSQPYVFVGNF